MNPGQPILMLAAAALWACAVSAAPDPVVGGPCAYDACPGEARIVSVAKKEPPPDPGREAWEVTFAFTPAEPVRNPLGQTEGREFPLLLLNSAYPGPRFLEKYGIREGAVFPCVMKVITRGTCTPQIFEFPGIRLDDYFEQ